MLRSIALVVACTAGIALWLPARGMTLDTNIDALKVAIDPSKGPPIAEPIFPESHSFPELGPPGPYTPERPVRMGLGGVAVVQCALALNGRLNKCALIADGPIGLNYGDAALKMASVGYLKAKIPAAFNDGDEVRVIVVFPRPARRPD
jgi:hypothetical protein